MHHAFLRAKPAQRRVVHEFTPRLTHVPKEVLHDTSDQQRRQRRDGGDLHIIAVPDREREPVSLEGITGVGLHADIGLSLIHISEPTRQAEISYAVFCLKKKKKK